MQGADITKRFGERIRALRAQLGESQEGFADLCGLHRTYVGAIERGEKAITIETAVKLASAFRLTLSELFAGL